MPQLDEKTKAKAISHLGRIRQLTFITEDLLRLYRFLDSLADKELKQIVTLASEQISLMDEVRQEVWLAIFSETRAKKPRKLLGFLQKMLEEGFKRICESQGSDPRVIGHVYKLNSGLSSLYQRTLALAGQSAKGLAKASAELSDVYPSLQRSESPPPR